MGRMADEIRRKLDAAFAPERLEVVDQSDRHKGHAGAHADGESHFDVLLVSEAFTGLNRVQRQRRVNETLAEELRGQVHALSIRALAPGEG